MNAFMGGFIMPGRPKFLLNGKELWNLIALQMRVCQLRILKGFLTSSSQNQNYSVVRELQGS